MKENKKFLALCLAAVMAASTSTVVFAEGETQAPADPTQNPKMETLTPETKAEVNLLTDPTTEAITNQEQLEKAIQQGGTVDLDGRTIELTSTLTISKSITLKNGTIDGSALTGDVILVTGDNVILSNLDVTGGTNSKHNIQTYGSSVQCNLNGVTSIVKGSTYQAPLLVNGGSTVSVQGFTADISGSTYSFKPGIDVSRGSELTGGNITVIGGEEDTPVIWADNKDATATVNVPELYPINDDSRNTADTANGLVYHANPNVVVGGEGYLTLEAALADPKTTDDEIIELKDDVTLSSPLNIDKKVTIEGNNHTIKAAEPGSYKQNPADSNLDLTI